jgi:NADPH-dependent 2,4-dienoyl-CoA reductase/sulfur reductase-like enzyme
MNLDWDKIKGAKEAVEDPNSSVTSIYTFEGAEKTRNLGKNFSGGKAVFCEPEPPIKCGGAPQKILYLLTDKWQKKGLKFEAQFNKPADVMFGVPKYSQALAKVAKGYGIDVQFKRKLVEVKKNEKIAVFQKGDKL